ncbi:MAG: 4-(cytidine 5'-diphospho)-2-C-methyl-D-erythritol kinase [Rickettsiales bacterium]|nr:4-(cytidine 5'-diphospho)-2-C-methyl-D-erythritol kinase [Rickettsiales bacterium]|tara:strand:- start:862 stop:1752 length:891 start_codon:yes stop_codon:yes gene_type:complete
MNMPASGPIFLEAPAKINLYLHVVGRRANGFHELESLIGFMDEFDTLTLTPAEELGLEITGTFAPGLSNGEDNLVLRAARALGKVAGLEPKVHIKLQKHLPVAAGLGSGSADAAATLRGLAKFWNIDTDKVDLREVGFGLGTDIPACLVSDTVHVSGVGERLEAGPILPNAGLVLVNPGVTLATPSVFHARRGGFTPASPMIKVPRNLDDLVTILENRSNDLTEPALRLAPVIREVLTALKEAPGCRLARLSGSGATCFGIFDNPDAAITAAGTIKTEGWWVRPSRFRSSNARGTL